MVFLTPDPPIALMKRHKDPLLEVIGFIYGLMKKEIFEIITFDYLYGAK